MLNLSTIRRVTVMLDMADVRPAPFNPSNRTNNKTGDIDELAKEIQEEGQLEATHTVEVIENGKKIYYTAEGHRRTEAMRKLGCQKIRSTVYDPAQENWEAVLHALYVKLNKDKRHLANRDMCESALAGGPMFNQAVKTTVKRVNELWPNGVPSLIRESIGTTNLNIVTKGVRYCWSSLKKGTKSFDDKVRLTFLWMIRNGQRGKLKIYMELKYSPSALADAIENNKLAPRVQTIGP